MQISRLKTNQVKFFAGIRKSELVEKQKSDETVDLGGRLRFDNSLVIFMDATPEVLEERLDGRVDKMIKLGLKNELIEFYNEVNI